MADQKTKILNSQQQTAVEYGTGSLLIIAGAGTGKTTVITERIKWLIAEGLAKTSEILALTFTEKASREMEERVDQALPYGYTDLWISTFHSFCDRVLRAEAVQIGLDPGYRLMTEAETIQFITAHLYEFDLKYFRPLGNPTKFIRGILQHFSRLQDEDVSPDQYLRWTKSQRPKTKDQTEESQKYLELAKAYERYEKLKLKDSLMDYGDLISQTLRLFRQRKHVLQKYRAGFKHILVDEFQDTNIAQYELIKLLAPPKSKPSLTVVGDDSQSIYKFRGAAVSNLLQFMDDYTCAKQVVLVKNYRSSQTILDHAYRLIKHNEPDTLEVRLGLDKNLSAVRKVENSRLQFLFDDRVENEAELVAEKIQELQTSSTLRSTPYAFSDFAILVRANNHAEPFTRALARYGIPFQFLGPGRLFRQPEVKELIAYLKVLYNFEDNVAFYRVLSMDLFGLSGRDLAALVNFAKKQNISLFEAAEKIAGRDLGKDTFSGDKNLSLPSAAAPRLGSFSEKGHEKISFLVKMIHRHLDLVPRQSAGQILYYFLDDSGLLKILAETKSTEKEKEVQNIAKFFDRLKTYEAEHEDAGLNAVVDWLSLAIDLGESPLSSNTDWAEENKVNLLTVHSAKGLEFPIVFLVNLVSERFPTRERREQIPIPDELIKEILPAGNFHEQEERRLFYVGMTRARDHLFLTAAKYYGEGKREKKISPFVAEALGKERVGLLGDQVIRTTEKQLSFLDWQKPVASDPGVTKNDELTTKNFVPITYLSFSQIDTFDTCPRQYRFKYFQRIPVPSSAAASFGTSIHLALRNFYQSVRDGQKPSEKDLLSFLSKNWKKEGFTSRAEEQNIKKEGQRMLAAYYSREGKSARVPLSLEQVFVIKVSPSLKVGGKIDRVDPVTGGIEIWDYKTGRVMDQKEIDKSLQMSVYALAASDPGVYGKKSEKITLSYYFLSSGEKKSTQRSDAQLKETKKEIIAKAQKIAQSDFLPTPGLWCHWCDFKFLCEAWS